MRQFQIQAEWKRARRALEAAEALRERELAEDAVSRAYYAVLHAAKAALLTRDIVTESHAAVRRLFGRELVRTGEIERDWAKVLLREQEEREVADYEVGAVINLATAEELVGDARRFLERMAAYLAAQEIVLEEEPRDV